MNPANRRFRASAAEIREEAARWTVRRDRGLSATESIEFEWWLAADERHRAALQQTASAWSLLDRIPESALGPVTRRPHFRRKWSVALLGGLAACGAGIFLLRTVSAFRAQRPETVTAGFTEISAAQTRTLSDGSIVCLNTGSEVVEHFTPAERRIFLVKGEAHFTVTKNPLRPFIVRAGTVEVIAVGTAFDVNLQSTSVEVLVTEGKVRVSNAATVASGTPLAEAPTVIPVLQSGQRALVALAPVSSETAVAVTSYNAEEVARSLAWEEPLLRFNGATLASLIGEFQSRSTRKIALADPALSELRIGGRFRADDFPGFIRLLQENYGITADTAADGTVVLRKTDRAAHD